MSVVGDHLPASEAEVLESTPNGADLGLLVLPSGAVSISESARAIFQRIAPSKTIFWRGGALVEISENEGVSNLLAIHPESFRSRVEHFGNLCVWRSGQNSESVLKPSKMSLDDAKAIMFSAAARDLLPPVSSLLRCPVILKRQSGEIVTLSKGYHHDLGGLLIVEGDAPPSVPFSEAVASIKWLFEEFNFQTEADRSRAIASLITPALRIGGHLRGNIPVDCAEADQSQAGKGYRHAMVCALYNEAPYFVTPRLGGVGSVDESFSAALLAGRPFICLDNFRGRLDSGNLESFLTCQAQFPARVPHRGEILIDPRRFIIQISSNGFESTPDLANRLSICRIRKRPGFAYRDTIAELRKRQPYFLGCVFAVIRAWISEGKLKSDDRRHDFTEWNQALDFIVRTYFKGAPLMDGHQAAQQRSSDPALSWLRAVALAVESENRLNESLIASELVDICEGRGIEIPGKPVDQGCAKRAVGVLCKRVFGEKDRKEIDGFFVNRGQLRYRKPSGDHDTKNTYSFTR